MSIEDEDKEFEKKMRIEMSSTNVLVASKEKVMWVLGKYIY